MKKQQISNVVDVGTGVGPELRQARLTFLNHAGFIVEDETSLLICDPWLEGSAFNGGWSLVDSSTSNFEVHTYCRDSRKQPFIWYSHEHSDHFNVKFLRGFVDEFPEVEVLFQKTIDRRVVAFLSSLGVRVVEVDESPFHMSPNLKISVFPFGGSDSFCFVEVHGRTILNLNDCSVNTPVELETVDRRLPRRHGRIDIMMTQFGYASWVGNEEDWQTREKYAAEILDRMIDQVSFFSPENVVPFASFVKFSLPDNEYLNDHQNTIGRAHELLLESGMDSRPLILSPWQSIDLMTLAELDVERENQRALLAWSEAEKSYRAPEFAERRCTTEQIFDAASKYRSTLNRTFLFLPLLLEVLRIRRPSLVWVADLDLAFLLSFRSIAAMSDVARVDCDVEVKSSVLVETLSKEYGADSLSVNGLFREVRPDSRIGFFSLFDFQRLARLGYGYTSPLATIRKVLSVVLRRFNLRRLQVSWR